MSKVLSSLLMGDAMKSLLSVLAVSLTVFYAGDLWAPYLKLPNNKYEYIEDGMSYEIARCFAPMYIPDVYKGVFPTGCEAQVEGIIKFCKNRKMVVKYLPLPSGGWYEVKKPKPFAGAWCDAYIENPSAFDSIQERMTEFGCALPLTMSIKNQVMALPSKIENAWNSANGMSSSEDCMKKYSEKIRLVDANAVLAKACRYGYEKNALLGVPSREGIEKSSRCIVASSEKFYSFESSLSVLAQCTSGLSNGAAIFNDFKYSLYQMTQKAQARQDEALRRDILLSPRLPITCMPLGDMITCN